MIAGLCGAELGRCAEGKRKGKGVGERELGSEREKEQSSGNNLRWKHYFTNRDIGMQDNTI